MVYNVGHLRKDTLDKWSHQKLCWHEKLCYKRHDDMIQSATNRQELNIYSVA